MTRLAAEDDGATLVEYSLILLLVVMASIAVVAVIGGMTQSMFVVGGSI